MHKRDNVFLVGLMGCGKTTVGRLLASRLGLAFHDSDRVVEARAGADIPWIFDVEGEAGFRARERAVIDELTALHGVVLATGGGAILAEENRRHLAARGRVVYLRASIDLLVRRTRRDPRRPLLADGDVRETLMRLEREREPLYRQVADIVVESNTRSPRAVVEKICHLLE